MFLFLYKVNRTKRKIVLRVCSVNFSRLTISKNSLPSYFILYHSFFIYDSKQNQFNIVSSICSEFNFNSKCRDADDVGHHRHKIQLGEDQSVISIRVIIAQCWPCHACARDETARG